MLTLEQAQTHLDQSTQLIEQGKYTEAMELLEQAAPIFEIAEKWEEYVQCLNKQSECFRHSGKYSGGIEKAEKALQICLERWGENNVDTAMCYHNLGNCNYYKGDHAQAIAYHQQALAIRLATIGEQHPSIASSYNNLGACNYYKGDHAQAVAYYQQALTIQLATVGEQHPLTADSYNNLGICYDEKGDYNQAITYYQQALNIQLATIGEQHPGIVASYHNLGGCYMSEGNHTRAIVYYQQALTIQLATIGEQHLDTASIYHNLGLCYYKKGDYTQAIAYYQQALTICLAIIGEHHLDTAINYHSLGLCYYDKGDYTQAIGYLQQALTIQLATVDEQCSTIACNYQNLGECYYSQSEYLTALHYHQQTLQSLALDVSNEDYYPLPKLAGYNSAVQLLATLPAKASILTALYHQNNTHQDICAALAHYQCADELIDQMRQSYKTEGSKLWLAEKGKDMVYDVGLATLFTYQLAVKNQHSHNLALSQFNQTLDYHLPDRPIDLAFHFSEKSKAVLLFAGMKDAEARLIAQLPPDLMQQEYNLRIEITYLERRISEEGYPPPKSKTKLP